MKYLVFGETIWDVYPDKRAIGGAPFNFSANVSLLGGECAFITGLGCDEMGERAAEFIRLYGVRDDFICYNDKTTGQCLVELDEKGVPRYNVLTDTAYDNIVCGDKLLEKIRLFNPDLFYFNTLIQRRSVSKKALTKILDSVRFKNIFCDVNIRPGCCNSESLDLCLSRATIVKISDEEAHFTSDFGLVDRDKPLPEELHRVYSNLRLLVYTMGKKGSRVYDFESGKIYDSGTPANVPVVSTVGAGDCYSASFLHTYLSGSTIEESMRTATERSNIVVAHTEAIPELFLKEYRLIRKKSF